MICGQYTILHRQKRHGGDRGLIGMILAWGARGLKFNSWNALSTIILLIMQVEHLNTLSRGLFSSQPINSEYSLISSLQKRGEECLPIYVK